MSFDDRHYNRDSRSWRGPRSAGGDIGMRILNFLNSSFPIGTYLGIRVRVHITFFLLVLFRIDPMEMYWAVEHGRAWPDSAARAAELEDFLTIHAGTPLAVPGEDAPYVRLKGRRYRPGLVAAARRLQELGGLARLRESLGSFETRPIDELRTKVNAWSRH